MYITVYADDSCDSAVQWSIVYKQDNDDDWEARRPAITATNDENVRWHIKASKSSS